MRGFQALVALSPFFWKGTLITICAFIVLNIFLSLLNIIFFWLPFVKICVPFPRKK